MYSQGKAATTLRAVIPEMWTDGTYRIKNCLQDVRIVTSLWLRRFEDERRGRGIVGLR